MTTPELLTSFETCDLKGFWSKDWQRRRLDPTQMLRQAIHAALTETERDDFGELAGETVMELGRDPGIEMPSSRDIYGSVVHHAVLADALAMALRSPAARPWLLPPPTALHGAPWVSSAFLDPSGHRLRRVVFATSWNDDRHYSEVRSWNSMGEMAVYGLPMQMVVVILGTLRDGRRSGPWTKGFLHPQNHKLRFRKKTKTTYETFSDKWEQVWREDRDEISTRQWLQAMLEDDILRDVCFTVDIPELDKKTSTRILSMASRKLERLALLSEPPEASMSVCQRCQFRGCCWSEEPYEPDEKSGFIPVA